jgi:hypothetical protein
MLSQDSGLSKTEDSSMLEAQTSSPKNLRDSLTMPRLAERRESVRRDSRPFVFMDLQVAIGRSCASAPDEGNRTDSWKRTGT